MSTKTVQLILPIFCCFKITSRYYYLFKFYKLILYFELITDDLVESQTYIIYLDNICKNKIDFGNLSKINIILL